MIKEEHPDERIFTYDMQELQVMNYYVMHGQSRIEYLLTYAAAKNSKLRFELSSLRTEPRVDWLVTLSYDEAKLIQEINEGEWSETDTEGMFFFSHHTNTLGRGPSA